MWNIILDFDGRFWCTDNRFCNSRFSISQLALKAGSSVAGAVEGSDNKDLEVLRQILRQIYSEAGLVEY